MSYLTSTEHLKFHRSFLSWNLTTALVWSLPTLILKKGEKKKEKLFFKQLFNITDYLFIIIYVIHLLLSLFVYSIQFCWMHILYFLK